MSILQNSNAISAGGYTIDNSLRFRASASAYLNRTPASASDRQKFTWSGWIKRGTLGVVQTIFSVGVTTASNPRVDWQFNASNQLEIDMNSSGTSWDCLLTTTQVFRDPSAWYHIVVAVDTTQATASNRVKIYVNGSQVTALSSSTYPAQNASMPVNNTLPHALMGYIVGGTQYVDGYLADVNFIDGSAKTPSDFGETDTTTGVWKPKAYTGTYGTNGFYLKFSDIATTSGSNAGLGKDFSGNTNYWTTNNISVTSGTTYDAMTDVPTNTSATQANFPVLNPISPASITATLSEANLKATGISTGTFESAISTMSFTSGKIYFECTCLSGTGSNASAFIGITNISNSTSGACFTNSGSGSIGWDINGTTLYTIINTTVTSRGAITPTNKVFRVAYDASTGNIWLGYDTTWIGGGDPSTLTTPTGTITTGVEYICGATLNTSNDSVAVNFGQRPFAQTIPTGFTSLNTYNLSTPTIIQGNRYMDATTYTGTGSSLSVTNAGGFQPDFVWIKGRSGATDHALYDTVRGTTIDLVSNSTAAETTQAQGVTAFNSNGFTVGTLAKLNTNTATYVGWQWDAGSSNATNTSGTITSTVRANTTAGFSIVTYTGNATNNATIGHGLGVAPKMVITKNRSSSTFWYVFHSSLPATNNLYLNATDAQQPDNVIRSTSSTTFTVSSSSAANGTSMVAYCFAEIAGFSKFGSYTGNGSTDGPFVFLGFRPKFILIKSSSVSATNWSIRDTTRNSYNVSADELNPNLSDAEGTTPSTIDVLSNGFKFRGTSVGGNGSGTTYIYAAFAESPFKNSLAR